MIKWPKNPVLGDIYTNESGSSGSTGTSGTSGTSGTTGTSGLTTQPALLSRQSSVTQSITDSINTVLNFDTQLQSVASIGLSYDSLVNIGRFTNISGTQKTLSINTTVAFEQLLWLLMELGLFMDLEYMV